MKTSFLAALSLLCISCAVVTATTPASKDAAPTEDVIDYYHGDKVKDPYRWMEESDDHRVTEWVTAQRQGAERYFSSAGLASQIRERLVEIEKTGQGNFSQLQWAGDKLFALKQTPPAPQPVLVAMPSYTEVASAEVLVDPNIMDPSGGFRIDWYAASHNGRYVAVSISKDGTQAGDLYVYDLTKKAPGATPNAAGNQKPSPPYQPIEPIIQNVNRATGGGDAIWDIKNKGFYYTRYPDTTDIDGEGALFQRLYYHKLGTQPSDDRKELGAAFDRIEQMELEIDPRSGRILATVQMGQSGIFVHYLRNPDGKWQQLSKLSDDAVDITFAPKGGMFLLSRESAPRGRLHFLASPKMPLAEAKRIVPQGNDSIVAGVQGARSMLVTKTRIYLVYQLGGPAEIRVFSQKGAKLDVIRIADANIGPDLVPLDGDEILFRADSFIEPSAWYRYDGILGAGSLTKTALSTSYGIGYDDAIVENKTAISADGAKVPLFIVRKRTTQPDGVRPTILFGDGGFGHAFTPRFSPALSIWLEHGGVAAFAAVRGGGEFGAGWHRAGRQVYKQNSIDDFVACAKYLVDKRYTNASRLGLSGSRNGALLVAAAMAQHPSLAGAVVASDGIYDMLRLEFFPAGEITVGEYGSVNETAQFKALVRYSPYHNTAERASYPAVLLMSGANDKRVLPWHSRKLAAQLRATNRAATPVLYRESANTGSWETIPFLKRISLEAEKLAFLFKQLGVTYQR